VLEGPHVAVGWRGRYKNRKSMSWYYVVFGILGLGLLMVVHELGHLVAARAFGMRVMRFSIGFGPTIWRHQARGSETVYQIALIPFLAYVQIAGMNPFEETDPTDRGSYANASLSGRITTIFAGPLGNYLFASLLFFAVFAIGGELVPTMEVDVVKAGAAEAAGLRNGDTIVSVDGTPVATWDQMKRLIVPRAKRPVKIGVMRKDQPLTFEAVPKAEGKSGNGQLGVQSRSEKLVPMSLKKAGVHSVVFPALVVEQFVVSLARIITGQEKPQFTGPPGIVREAAKAAQQGWVTYLTLLGVLSAYLAGFNLLPIPALDGGRLMFLGYEAVARRRPNARVEAQVHAVGLVLLIALIAVVSVFDFQGH
jgi:regulator of sigma E protease